MSDVPAGAVTAAVRAMNEAHTRRGWNEPALWWAKECAAAMVEAAAPLLAADLRRAVERAEALLAERDRQLSDLWRENGQLRDKLMALEA